MNRTTEDALRVIADELADAVTTLPEDERIVPGCRLAYQGIEATPGADRADRARTLGSLVTKAIADRKYADDPDAHERSRKIPLNRPGGASLSESALRQRANAWADILAARVDPTPAAVAAAFRLTSIGGSVPYRESVRLEVFAGADFTSATHKAADALTAENLRRKKR